MTVAVALRRPGEGSLGVVVRAPGAPAVEASGSPSPRAARALPRLRRALERRRPARQHGRELRRRRPLPAAERPRDRRRRRPAVGCRRDATTRPTTRSRGCSRRAATACSSTTTRRSRFHLGATPRLERRGRDAAAARPARLRRPATRRRAAPLHRRAPAASRRRAGAVVLRPLVPAGQRRRRRGAVARAARAADAPVSVARDLHALPARAAPSAGSEARRARPHARRSTPPGWRVTTYFNPMICTSLQPRSTTEAARRGALPRRAAGDPYVYRYIGLDARLPRVAPVRLHGAGRAGALRAAAAARPSRDGHDGWMEDFGEYTPPDARSRRRHARHRDAQPLPARTTTAPRATSRAAARRPLARFQRSGWTGAARCVARSSGAATRPTDWGFDGLRVGGHQRADHGPVRRQPLGLRHRRLLLARARPQLDARAARALDRARRGRRA